MLDHVLDLSLHRQEEKGEKIYEEDWPEDGDVEDGKEGHDERREHAFRARVPELEFGNSAREWAKLFIIITRWKHWALAVGVNLRT